LHLRNRWLEKTQAIGLFSRVENIFKLPEKIKGVRGAVEKPSLAGAPFSPIHIKNNLTYNPTRSYMIFCV
jgi:hypothetical protein